MTGPFQPEVGAEAPPHRALYDNGFRMRGREINRLEAFSDVVFGFALTLVGISLEVPHNFADLAERLKGFPAFAICFAILVHLWYAHYKFFRRYDLQDSVTVFWNAVLLALILTYVYPLKFLFTLVTVQAAGTMPPEHIPLLMAMYGVGYAAVWAVFAALYGHALRVRGPLDLSPLEIFETRRMRGRALLQVGVGAVAAGLALGLGAWVSPQAGGYSGFFYFLLWPFIYAYEWTAARRRERLFPR